MACASITRLSLVVSVNVGNAMKQDINFSERTDLHGSEVLILPCTRGSCPYKPNTDSSLEDIPKRSSTGVLEPPSSALSKEFTEHEGIFGIALLHSDIGYSEGGEKSTLSTSQLHAASATVIDRPHSVASQSRARKQLCFSPAATLISSSPWRMVIVMTSYSAFFWSTK